MSEQQPEFRFDPIRQLWTAYAPRRIQRPHDSTSVAGSEPNACPFCRGREHVTPPAVLTIPIDERHPKDWAVRVVPNGFPAATPSHSTERQEISPTGSGEWLRQRAVGYHEVVVESPEHLTQMNELDESQFRRVVRAYRDRMKVLRQDERIAHASLWKNSGADAGASLSHVHSQILAAPFVSSEVQRKLEAADRFRQFEHGCPWCELITDEIKSGTRIVHSCRDLIAFCPFVSRFAAEIWIMPREHRSDFDRLSDHELNDLAAVWHHCLCQLEIKFHQPAYNFALHTAPFRGVQDPSNMHWHIEIMPRINGIAGFELGSGNWINTILPEDAAQRLRF